MRMGGVLLGGGCRMDRVYLVKGVVGSNGASGWRIEYIGRIEVNSYLYF